MSKHFKGYELMKSIMAQESSSLTQGVPSFAYSPASVRQPILFELARPLDDLANMLLSEFAGETLTMKAIYEKHSIGRPYLARNYKDVLRQLEAASKIITHPPAAERRTLNGQVTFADDVLVLFPHRRVADGDKIVD